MATMKPLNVISTEQLSANREAKKPVLTESDGQAFSQTLRQQMQQESNKQTYRDTEDRISQHNLEAQSRLSQQQTERARFAMQKNQTKPAQVNKPEETNKSELANKLEQDTSVAQASTPLESKANQANAVAKEKASNKIQNDHTDLTVEEPVSDETNFALTDLLPTTAEASTTAQNADSLTEKNANQAGLDENAIANMGWLASMMAMRDNQAIPANKPIAKEAENTIATSTLTADITPKIPKMLEADGLLDKTAIHAGEETIPFDDLPSMQANSVANNPAADDTQGLALGKVIGSEDGLASFAKENIANATFITQPVVADNQSVGISKALEQLTKKLEANTAENVQSVLNAQATTSLNTSNVLAQSPQAMVSQVNVPFGIQGWQEAMNKQVMQMTQQGNELATLTLSPPDLGPVQVVLRVDNQSVDTAFISDNANVRQALQDGLQDLKERMASQGLQLGNTFVGNGNQAQQHFDTQARSSSTSVFSQLNTETEHETVVAPVRTKPLGMVDTFV